MIKILVEGPDGQGKTTLVKDLCDFFSPQVIGIKYPLRARDLKEANNRIRHLMFSIVKCQEKEILIWDRHLIVGERVYGPILRRKSIIPAVVLDAITTNFVLNPRNLLIFCMTINIDPNDILPKENKSISMVKSIRENYARIVYEYYHIYHHTPLIYHYDWKETFAFRDLIEFIEKIREEKYYECE